LLPQTLQNLIVMLANYLARKETLLMNSALTVKIDQNDSSQNFSVYHFTFSPVCPSKV